MTPRAPSTGQGSADMTDRSQVDEIGPGALSRITAAVYRFLVLFAFLVLNCAPTVVVWTLLAPDPTNTALFVAAMLPVAPALSAAVYALRAWSGSPDLHPAKALFRGYARNLVDTLKWWVVVLAICAVLVVNLVFAGSVRGAAVLRPVCLVLLMVLGVWSAHLLVVTSLFSFRTRDALRVAAVEMFSQWKASLGILSLIVVAAAVVGFASEAVLALLAWAFVGLLWITARPVEADVSARFVRHE